MGTKAWASTADSVQRSVSCFEGPAQTMTEKTKSVLIDLRSRIPGIYVVPDHRIRSAERADETC